MTYRPITADDLKAAMAARAARKARRNELVSTDTAPWVFAPRHMWKRGTVFREDKPRKGKA